MIKAELKFLGELDTDIQNALIEKPSLDEVLVQKGFSYVKAIVERNDELYSTDSLKINKLHQFDLKWFHRQSERKDQLKLDLIESNSKKISPEDIHNDESIPYMFRDLLLMRFFPDYYSTITAPFAERLLEAKQDDFEQFCVRTLNLNDQDVPKNSKTYISFCSEIYNQTCDDLLSLLEYVNSGKTKGFSDWKKVLAPKLNSNIQFDYRGTFGAGVEHTYLAMGSEYVFEVAGKKYKYYPSKYTAGLISKVHYRSFNHIWDFELATRVGLESYVLIHEIADPLAINHFTAFCDKNC